MAATTMGTNIVADEQALSDLMKTLLDDIKRLLDYNISTKKERLLKELYNRISHGEQCIFKFVPQQFTERIERALQEQNIPYHTIYGQNGDVAFLVTNRDKEKLMDIQKEIFMTSTAYFAQAKASSILETSKKHSSEKGPVVRLSFKDENREGFEFVKQQLYNNKIVSGVLDFENVEKIKDGDKLAAQIYISSDDYFNRLGQDISKIELEYAIHQTINGIDEKKEYQSLFAKNIMGDYFKHKENKLKYDNEQIKEFAKQIKAGKRAILGDVTNGSESYLQTENGKLQIVSKSNGTWTPHEIDDCKGADLQSIISVISSYAEHISNMHVYANVQEHDKQGIYRLNDFNPDVILTANEQIEAIKKTGRVHDFDEEHIVEQITSKIKDIHNENLKNIDKNDIKKLEEEMLRYEEELKNLQETLPSRIAQKKKDNSEKLEEFIKKDALAKTEIEKITEVLQNISRDASQYVAEFSNMKPNSKKYHEREELIISALKNDNNVYIKQYLEGHLDKEGESHLSREDRVILLKEVLEHYRKKDELMKNEMIVEDITNDKNLMKEVLQDEYDIEHAKAKLDDKNKDKNREEDKEHDSSKNENDTKSQNQDDVNTQDEVERDMN